MENIIIIIVMLLLIYFLIVGQYISSIFLSLGALGIFLVGGTTTLSGFLRSDSFSQAASYSLTTIPLFVLMAQFVMGTRIIEDLYDLSFRISRGKKGPLGVITIVLGAMLGSVSGSSTATTAAMTRVTLPELEKRGYSSVFSGAIVATSGSLSSIIPPSVILIIYGVVAHISIGQLFIGALIPGILMTVIFSIIIIMMSRSTRHTEKASGEKFISEEMPIFRYVIALLTGGVMAIVVFGGIFTGFFTPTEAGAVGAFTALIFSIILGKFNLKFLQESLTETTKITAMTMFIVIGASLFGKFVSLSLVPRKIINILDPLMDSPNLIIIILLAFYFILFMFIDSIAVILMTVPMLMPVIEAIQVDPLWFGILVSISCTIGLISPPVGSNVFVVGSMTGISIERIFAVTFIVSLVTSVIILGLLILFPELVTWLPSFLSN